MNSIKIDRSSNAAVYLWQLLRWQRGLCIAAFTAAMQPIYYSFYGGSTVCALQLLQLQCSPFVAAFTVATRSACCREISRQQHGAFAAAFTVATRSVRRRDKSRRRNPYPPPPPNPPPVPKEGYPYPPPPPNPPPVPKGGDASPKRSASL